MSKDKVPSAKRMEKLWSAGQFACPECGFQIGLDTLELMRFNECPKCKAIFYAPQRVKDFYLFAPAGGGGMGSVYKAVSPRFPDRLLAVKLLAREEQGNPGNIHALLNEAQVSGKFAACEFLAGCLDAGYDNGEYFTAMDYIEGERLDKRIERLVRLPEPEVIAIALHVLAAEQHIYRHGFLFRDLKPENIIINEKGYAILIDFGLCISREHALNPDEDYVSGSAYYLPPERLTGQGEDARSEIYSLGMVMYHALTGKTYFDASEIDALAKRHLSKLRVSTEAKLEEISPPLAAILGSMIAQEPESRPGSFEEVFVALKALLD